MNLLEIYTAWKKLEFWNQVGVSSGVIAIVLAILALAGVQMHLFDLSLLFLFCGFGMLVYGNIQQSRKLADATDELRKVDGRIDQATTSVYNQKNKEIGETKMEVAAWKDKATGYQDKAASLDDELTKWQNDCKMLFEWKNELEIEKQRLQEKLQRIYDINPSLNPEHKTSYSVDVILEPTTPRQARLSEIDRRLKEIKKS
jgi:chromosome segregation ATPase